MWVTKLLIFPVEIRIFCPKTTKFGPKLAFLVNFGQAMQAYSMPCCESVGGCGARGTYLLYHQVTAQHQTLALHLQEDQVQAVYQYFQHYHLVTTPQEEVQIPFVKPPNSSFAADFTKCFLNIVQPESKRGETRLKYDFIKILGKCEIGATLGERGQWVLFLGFPAKLTKCQFLKIQLGSLRAGCNIDFAFH